MSICGVDPLLSPDKKGFGHGFEIDFAASFQQQRSIQDLSLFRSGDLCQPGLAPGKPTGLPESNGLHHKAGGFV